MTDCRNFLKQTATLTVLGTLSYPALASEQAAKSAATNAAPPLRPTDIRCLTQHFSQPGGGIEPIQTPFAKHSVDRASAFRSDLIDDNPAAGGCQGTDRFNRALIEACND